MKAIAGVALETIKISEPQPSFRGPVNLTHTLQLNHLQHFRLTGIAMIKNASRGHGAERHLIYPRLVGALFGECRYPNLLIYQLCRMIFYKNDEAHTPLAAIRWDRPRISTAKCRTPLVKRGRNLLRILEVEPNHEHPTLSI